MRMTKEEKLLRDMLKPERDEINLLYSRKDYDQKLSPLITAMRKAVQMECVAYLEKLGRDNSATQLRWWIEGKR